MKNTYDPEAQQLMDDYYQQLVLMYRHYHDLFLNTSIQTASNAWTKPVSPIYPNPKSALNKISLIMMVYRLLLRVIRDLLNRQFLKQTKLPNTMVIESKDFERAAHEYLMSRFYYW
jgi:hypothetical protein